MKPPRRIRRRHAQIHLPPLRGDQALRLVALFDEAIAAIWRAHGDSMHHELGLHSLDDAHTSDDPDPAF